jgi:hypothetical protein
MTASAPVFWTLDAYRIAALERIGEALSLQRAERYGIAMYIAGVAAECMLRAYHVDRAFDERHDFIRLFQAFNLDRLGEAGRRRLRGPVQTIHQLWDNGYRFAHEAMVRAHLHHAAGGRRRVCR